MYLALFSAKKGIQHDRKGSDNKGSGHRCARLGHSALSSWLREEAPARRRPVQRMRVDCVLLRGSHSNVKARTCGAMHADAQVDVHQHPAQQHGPRVTIITHRGTFSYRTLSAYALWDTTRACVSQKEDLGRPQVYGRCMDGGPRVPDHAGGVLDREPIGSVRK